MSWGREIAPNEHPWVGALIDEEIAKRDKRIAELEAEEDRLRELVADAYDEGFEDATRCGHGWSASEAKKALGG